MASPTTVAQPTVAQTGAGPAQAGGASQSDAGQRGAQTNQDTGAGSTTAVSEVVVTSSTRGQTVQRVPAAVTAFTDERRNLLGVETGRDIANLTPSVSLEGDYITVRGVGRYADAGSGIDPGIAVNVDGAYTSSPAYLNEPDFITDRIEVLRGPQSVFGRNSIGGTVNEYSKRPTDNLHGELRAGYTTFDQSYLQGAVSGPITPTLKYRLDASFANTNSGSQDNVGPGRGDLAVGSQRLYAAQLEWTPTPNLDIWTRYQAYSAGLSGTYGIQSTIAAGFTQLSPYFSGTPGFTGNYFSSLFYGLAPNPQFGTTAVNPSTRDPFKTALDDPGHIDYQNDHLGTTNITYKMPWATLKYIGSYQQYDYKTSLDSDNAARLYLTSPGGRQVPAFYQSNTLQQKKFFSNELILQSLADQPLRWVAGLYQYQERYKTDFSQNDPLETTLSTVFYANGTPAPANPNRAFYSDSATLTSQNEAFYGRVEYDVIPKVTLTGDFRYNFDQRSGGNRYREIFDLYGIYGDLGPKIAPPIGLDVTPGAGTPAVGADGNYSTNVKKNFSDWSGKVEAEWHPDSSTTAYFEIARGYKSGGFNLGSFATIPVVKPETLTDYEGGVKKTFGRKLLVNASAYYYDYSNLQVPITVGLPITNPVTGVTGINYATTLANAQKTHSVGFELESVYSPLENLHLTLVYSYQDARLDDFHTNGVIHDPASGANFTNLKNNTIPQAPNNKVSFIPQYVAHLPVGDLSLSATYTFTGKTYYGVFNNPFYQAPSYYNLDLRAVYQPKNSPFTVIAYARNVTDTRQFIYYGPGTAAVQVFPGNETLYELAEPRSFGAEIQYRF